MCCAGPCTGINTGPCITGDPDCDGDPNHTSALLASQRGVDDPLFDSGEAVLFVIDFGPDHTIDPLNKSEAVLIGKPTGLFPGQQNITHIRAAKYGLTQPHLAFGDTITAVTVSTFNVDPATMYTAAPHLIGPNATYPHMEFRISPFSALPAALGLSWDRTIACIAYYSELGRCVFRPHPCRIERGSSVCRVWMVSRAC